jgi:SAM-dependent methyltransferase
MSGEWLNRWNERFSKDEYAYGEYPNNFLREQLEKLKPGTILFAAEGEGRNAVFAARQGWTVSAFDISAEGKNKALRLAEKNKVVVDYQIGELQSLDFKPGQFDAIALIYAHFPPKIKSLYHRTLDGYLRKRGAVIFEAFSKKHLDYLARNPKVGGPTDIAMLFSIDELKSDFPDYEIILLEEKEIDLNEGAFHQGTGSVIRFIGRKE